MVAGRNEAASSPPGASSLAASPTQWSPQALHTNTHTPVASYLLPYSYSVHRNAFMAPACRPTNYPLWPPRQCHALTTPIRTHTPYCRPHTNDPPNTLATHAHTLPVNPCGHPRGRPLWSTLAVNPCGQPLWSTRVVNPRGQPLRSTLVVNPCGQPLRSTLVVNPRGQPLWSTPVVNP